MQTFECTQLQCIPSQNSQTDMDFLLNLFQNMSFYTNTSASNTTNNTILQSSNVKLFSAEDFNKLLLEWRIFPTWRFAYIYDMMKVIASAIFLLNAYIILLSIRWPKLRAKSNILLTHLAFVDLIVGMVCVPLFVTSQKRLENALYSTYIDALRLYVVTKIIIHTKSLLTILNLLVIILERFISLRFPLKHIQSVTGTKIKATLLAIWFVSIAYTTLSVLIHWSLFTLQNMSNFASIFRLAAAVLRLSIKLDEYKFREVYYSLLVVSTVLSAIFLFLMFTTIYKRPIRNPLEVTTTQILAKIKRELKAVKVLSIMVLTIMIWLAPTIYAFIGDYEKLQYVALYLGRFIISLTNPVLFTLYKKDFKQAAKQDMILVKRMLCRLRTKSKIFSTARPRKDPRKTGANIAIICANIYVTKDGLTPEQQNVVDDLRQREYKKSV